MTPMRVAATMFAGLALVVTGCGGSPHAAPSSTTPTTRKTDAVASPSTTVVGAPAISGHHHVPESAESRALAAKLPTAVTGYVLQPNAYSDAGPSDLGKAIDDSRDQAERKGLESDGFVIGYQRTFLTPEKERRIDYSIYQFADVAGASDFKELKARQEFVRLRGSKALTGSSSGMIPGIPNSEFSGSSDTLQFHEVMFAKGTTWVSIRTYYFRTIHSHDPHGATGHLSAMDLATKQYARL